MIAIVDYGIGNIQSLVNFLKSYDSDVLLSAEIECIKTADLVLMPGVGSFGPAMQRMKSKGLDDALTLRHKNKLPILGICLGMQLMFEASEESASESGLGWFEGTVRAIPNEARTPHMGWNEVTWQNQRDDFYFVHSYYADTRDSRLSIGSCDYQLSFPAIIQCGKTIGIQFHPEISSGAGKKLMHQLMKEWQLCLKK